MDHSWQILSCENNPFSLSGHPQLTIHGSVDYKNRKIFLFGYSTKVDGLAPQGLQTLGFLRPISEVESIQKNYLLNAFYDEKAKITEEREALLFYCLDPEGTPFQLRAQFVPQSEFLSQVHAHHVIFRLVNEFQVSTNQELNVLKDRHMVFEIGDYKALYSIQESKNTLVQIFKPKTASTTTASAVIPSYIPVNLFLGSSPSHTPTLQIKASPLPISRCSISLDIIIFAALTEPIATTLERLTEAINQQYTVAITIAKQNDSPKIQAYHFDLPNSTLPATTLYPIKDDAPNEDYYVSIRADYHKQYHLPSAPILRPHRAINFEAHNSNNPKAPMSIARLLNVHYGLPKPDKEGDEVLVHGTYSYFHYTQDGINDNGWGCAYRSLQTIESWFIHQKYTSKPVQSHKEIQRALYSLGQRTKQFIGSNEWIGSIEIQMALKSHMNVTSKILHLPKGSEIGHHTHTLINHFQRQGTPIMIGGGMLAFTLLGIHHNPKSDRTMYLILDPHYPGKDDLSTIQNKGWCGWKEASVIFKDCFFNLCLPQIPTSQDGI